ncbi:MAG: hypothetical protein NWF01_03480 [Candidatus Bathyarchaeota archaeon]|nr:hypothetical protein [Candidatus Bathyarchaeota archaeon]
MKKKSILLLFSVLALTVVIVISGLIVYLLNINMSATVGQQGDVTVFIAEQQWTNGTTIPWGTVHFGDNYLPINITSNVNTELTPTIAGAPTGWTISLSLNSTTIDAFGAVTGNVVLTVPSGALAQEYNWASTLTIE